MSPIAVVLLIFVQSVSSAASFDVVLSSQPPPGEDDASRYRYHTRYLALTPQEVPVELEPDVVLQAETPLHGNLEVGLHGRKVWFAADQSGPESGYDVLYCDSDLDGTITAQERYVAHEHEPGGWLTFGDIDIELELADGSKSTLKIEARPRSLEMPRQPEVSIDIVPKTERWGKLTLDGRELRVYLIDLDCNGIFEVGTRDMIRFSPPEGWRRTPDPLEFAKGWGWQQVSIENPLSIEAKLFDASVDPAGTLLKLGATSVPTASVRFEFRPPDGRAAYGDARVARIRWVDVKEHKTYVLPWHPERWFMVPDSGAFLEHGRGYLLYGMPVVLDDEAGQKWSALISTEDPLHLVEGGDNVFTYERVERLLVQPQPNRQKMPADSPLSFTVVAVGDKGERYSSFSRMIPGSDVPPRQSTYREPINPRATVKSSGGEVVFSGDMTGMVLPWSSLKSIPGINKAGEYSINVTLDTGPFAGLLEAEASFTVVPEEKSGG